MSLQNLDAFFAPQHIALVGATPKAGSVGRGFADNLLAERGRRTISFVNPNHSEILGEPSVASLGDIPTVPDLAIIATPPDTVPAPVYVGLSWCRAVRAVTVAHCGAPCGPQHAVRTCAFLDRIRKACSRRPGH